MQRVRTVKSGLNAKAAIDFHNGALRVACPAQLRQNEIGNGLTDQDIVTTDPLDELVCIHVPVQHKDRNARRRRLFNNTGQPGCFLWRNQNRIDALLNETFDLRDLFFGPVIGIGHQQGHVGVQIRLGAQVFVELHPPRLDRGDL